MIITLHVICFSHVQITDLFDQPVDQWSTRLWWAFGVKRWSHYSSTAGLRRREPELSAWQEQRPGVWPLSAPAWVHGWKQAVYQRADMQPTVVNTLLSVGVFSLSLYFKIQTWATVAGTRLWLDPFGCLKECNKMRNVVFVVHQISCGN